MPIIHNFVAMILASARRGVISMVLLLFICGLNAQITIDGTSLPEDGDSILYKTVSYPESRILVATGRDVLWDYSYLHSPFLSFVSFEQDPNDEDLLLAYEDGVFKYSLIANEGTLSIKTQESHHVNGKVMEFSDVENIRPANLRLGKEDFDQSLAFEILEQEEIPESLRNRVERINLPLKISTQTMVRSSVDAAGTLVLPWGAEDALLVKVLRTIKLICTYQEGEEWVELSEEQLSFLNLDYEQSYTDYHFYSESSKLPLMTIHRDQQNKIEYIKYQVREVGQNDVSRASGAQEIAAYPNPTFGQIKFEFLNYPKGNYVIELKSVLGKTLWTQSYDIEKDGLIIEDFSFLRRSTYVYTISDEYGNKLTTKRLVIITP